jgi:putative SOS response-associated peptidase YedK
MRTDYKRHVRWAMYRKGHHPPTFTMLTTAPEPDVAPYHNRQVVVVRPEGWSAWTRPSTGACTDLDDPAAESDSLLGKSDIPRRPVFDLRSPVVER